MSQVETPGSVWLDAAIDSYIAADASGLIVEWNQAAAQLLGWSRQEALGQPLLALVVPQRYRERYQAGTAATFPDGRQSQHVLTRGGEEIPVEVTAWRDAAAGARHNAFLRDLRPRNAAEATRELYASVVQSSQDAIVTKTLQGVITSWNPAAEKVLGYSAEEAVGKSILMLIPPERHPEEAEILARLRAGQRIEQYETVRMAKDGRLLDVSLMISPLRGADGTVVGASKILRDMTERRRIERALQAERGMLETVNEVGRTLLRNLNLEELLQAVTDAATRLSGAEFGACFFNTLDRDGKACQLVTLSGADSERRIRPGQPRATPLFGPTFDGSAAVIRIDDVTLDPRYGQWAPHYDMLKGHPPVRSYLAVPILSRGGTVEGGLFFGNSRPGVFTEREERLVRGLTPHVSLAIDNARLFQERSRLLESEQRARREAERASTSKDEFMATLSHELRTPLNAILGWTTIMERGPDDAESRAKGLEIIRRNARAQAQLIDDLMDMSRIISGQMRLGTQAVMPLAFIQGAVESLRPAAESRGVRLEAVLDPRAGPVNGDPARLQQVVWNLVANAIKFTPAGGRVQVSLERVNSHLEINVADTGMGIAPELLPHLFERYWQGDSSTTRKHGGLGLGLAIAKHIVDRHGGSIQAKSPGPGQGATFRIGLPLAVAHRGGDGPRAHPTAAWSDVALPQADLGGLKILVVDDEPDACEMLVVLLGAAGAEVVSAGSAAEALALIQADPPAVLVSDIGMREMDGYELLRQVRGLPRQVGASIPAIALTAFARSEDRTRALLAGFIAHVSKPVEPPEIIATIASVVGRTGSQSAS